MKTVTRIAIVLAAILGFGPAFATGFVFQSKSVLEPGQEVPPVEDSEALGIGIIQFNVGMTKADVKVTFSNLSGEFSRLHLHCAPEGVNGPIVVGFVDLVSIANDNSEVATLDSNTVTAAITDDQVTAGLDCEGQIINDLADLGDAINSGNIYWNLHTFVNPPGEIRGQLEPAELIRIPR